MVSVARSFDAPVKLLFPKSLFANELQFSMLGLGDIVIPGIFIALLLRFDAKHSQRAKKVFKKTYFNTTFLAYILGLATTIFVMHTFQAAQPALLYLVPFCIGASFITALVNRQLSLLLAYSEETPAEDKNEKNKKNEGEPKKKQQAQQQQSAEKKKEKEKEKEKASPKNNTNNNNNEKDKKPKKGAKGGDKK